MNYNRYENNRRDRENGGMAVLKIIISFVIITISILSIVVVVRKVLEIKIFEKINLKAESHNSLIITTDSNEGNSLFVTDDKGLKFRKEDKTFARDEWIDKNGELFYFDTGGYGLNGQLKKEGQVYTFENGKLKSIKRDTSYVVRADDEYFSSIKSAQYLVWLADEPNEIGCYPIKYHLTSDDYEDYLGTIGDKQYSSPNMMKIYMSDIYYLAVGKGTEYAGRLCRMRPGAIHKETVGVGVEGYIVLSEDVVYYYDGSRVIKARNWKGVELNAIEDIEPEIIDTLSLVPATMSVATKSDVLSDITMGIKDGIKSITDTIGKFDFPIVDKKDPIVVEEQADNKLETMVIPNIEKTNPNMSDRIGINTYSQGPVSREISEPTSKNNDGVVIGVAPGQNR